MGAPRKGNIRSAIDQNPALGAAGQRHRILCQFKKFAVGEVFFSQLNEVDPPRQDASHV